MSLSSNVGRHRVRRPPTNPSFAGGWGPNPYTLYGSHGRTHTPPVPGMQEDQPARVPPVPLAHPIIAPQVYPDPLVEED